MLLFLGEGIEGGPVKQVGTDYYPRFHLVIDGETAQGPVGNIDLATVINQIQGASND